MKNGFLFILFACTIIIQVSSCKKSNSSHTYNVQFPNNIGSWWKYTVFDSVSNSLDSLNINVIGMTKLDDGTDVTIWAINSISNGSDTNFVSNKSDGIRIFHSRLSTATPIKRLMFPLTVGSKWITQNVLDTNTVTQQGLILVTAGSFSGFRIDRHVIIPPGYNLLQQQEWFVEDIGMVSRYYVEIGPGYMRKEKWELISYSIK